MDWLNFLKIMAFDEEAAYKKYDLAAQLADAPDLKKMMERLRDEEQFHAQYLVGEYEKMRRLLEEDSD